MELGLMQSHALWDSAPGHQLEGHQWHMGETEESSIGVSAGRQVPPRQNSRGQGAALSPLQALPHTEPQSSGDIAALPWG